MTPALVLQINSLKLSFLIILIKLKQQSAASGEELMSQLTKTKEELERAFGGNQK